MSDLDIGTLVAHLKVDDAGMDFKGALEKIKGFGGEGGKAAKVAGVAIAAGLATAVASAMNVEPARKKIAAQLRLTPAEQATINASADKLFSGNYAENIGEANDVLRSVITNFKDMRNSSSEDLTAVGVMAQNTASLMGEEFDKVTKVAGQLVKDGLAKNATEAFDLITAASQNTSADMQGDLLEVAGEYSKHFATLGISGSEAMKLISDASANGAIGMDKVGDALKELTIRATDMSTSSVAAYQAAGLNAQEMSDQILKGGDSAHAGFEKIVNGLLSIQDPTARANAAIGLFGTPLEDLGTDKIPAFLNSLKDAGAGLGDVAGRADEAGKMLNDSTQASFQSMLKTIQTKATELGEAIIPFIKPLVDGAGVVIGWVSDIGSAFGQLPGPVKIGILAVAGIALVAPKVIMAFRMIKQEMALATYGMGSFAGGWSKIGKLAAGGAGLIGVSLLIGAISDSFAEIKARQQEVTTTTTTLTDALVANGGAWNESIRAQQVSMIANTDAFKALVGAGVSYADAMDFMTGKNKEFFVEMFRNSGVMDKLGPEMAIQVVRLASTGSAAEAAAKQQYAYNEAQKDGSAAAADGATKYAALGASLPVSALEALHQGGVAAAGGLDELSQTDADTKMGILAGQTADAWAAFDTAADSSSALEGKLTPMAQAAQDAADAQSDLDDATRRVLTALDKLAGRTPDVEQANSDLAQATADMADKFKLGTDEAESLGGAILNTDGTIKTATQGGRDLRDSTLGVREAMATAAQAAYDNAVANGDLKGAQGKATEAAQVGYDAFIKNATAILGSKSAAERAATAYGLVPKQVSSTITADNSQAVAAANEVARKLAALAVTSVTATATMITNLVTNRTETITTRHETIGGPKWMGGSLRGYAAGSPNGILGLPAPSDPRQDNLLGIVNGSLFKFRGDEFIMNPKASKVFGPELKRMNAMVPAFASGGVPSAGSLGGLSTPSQSGRQGITSGALGELRDFLINLKDIARESGATARDSMADVTAARAEAKAQTAEANAARKAATASLAEDRKSAAEKLADAKKQYAEDVKAHGDAPHRLAANNKLRAAQAEYNKSLAEAGSAYNKSTAAANKDIAAAKANVTAAERAFNADNKAAAAATARAAAEAKVYNTTAGLRSMLGQLSKQWDSVSASLETARGTLTGLQSDRSSMIAQLGSSIAGYDSGILGHADQRKTAADVLRGLQFDQNKVAGFTADINRAKSLGLSASLLQQIAGAGVDGGGVTAHALATATKAQVAAINATVAKTLATANVAGTSVAGATYDGQIKAQTALVTKLTSILSGVGSIESQIANALSRMSLTMKIDPQGVARLVATGQKELARR